MISAPLVSLCFGVALLVFMLSWSAILLFDEVFTVAFANEERSQISVGVVLGDGPRERVNFAAQGVPKSP